MTHRLLGIVAELTHRCPLRCAYCSNPLELTRTAEELRTDEWTGVFRQAARLGVRQVHLTGGEPLARPDLAELARAARELDLYVNLITSGIGLTPARLDELVGAGVEHIQLSIQDARAESGDAIAGARVHELKLAAARLICEQPVALTVNVVLHRLNIERTDELIELAIGLGPQKIELAHVQLTGWAFRNRAALLATRAQVERSLECVARARARLRGKIRLELVAPDYHADFPKACMGGWGRRQLVIDPAGTVLPCHSARLLPGLVLENVRTRPLEWIWESSPSFNRFRGEDWLPEPCRSCERKSEDFGGCRCQAYLVAGDAAETDPVCRRSAFRGRIDSSMLELAACSPPSSISHRTKLSTP